MSDYYDDLLLEIQLEQEKMARNTWEIVPKGEVELMAGRYTGFQAILNAGLGEYAAQGFSLKEIADDAVELYFKDKKIATYNQNLTIPLLHEGCRNFLKNTGGY